MADSTINGLTALSGANVDNTADQFAIWDNSDNTTKKITRTELLTGIPAGTAAAPAISFAGDPDTGIFGSGANSLSIAVGGAERVIVGSQTFRISFSGSAAAPSISTISDTNTGLYFPSADTLGLVTGGVERLRIFSGQQVVAGNTAGSVSGTIPDGAGASVTPQLQNVLSSGVSAISAGVADGVRGRRVGIFVDDTNGVAGISTSYSSGGGIPFVFRDAGGERFRIDSAGNLLVGTASANGSLTVVGAQSVDGSTYYVASLAANNSPVAGRGSGLAFRTNVGSFTPVICAIEGVKENGTTDDYASALDFSTRVNGGFMTKRLRIKSTGQVNFVGLASDPAGAAAGDVYYNTTTNKLKCYNGTTWNDLF